MLTPKDVFTPGRPPIEATNVYTSRGEHEKDFTQALDRSLIPVVYGDYGVGKTSMARHVLLDKDRQGKVVNIESVQGKSFADIVAGVLEHLGYEVTKGSSMQNQSSLSRTATGELGGTVFGLTAKVSGARTAGQFVTTTLIREMAVTSPTDSRVLDLCESNALVLLVDELHRGDAALVSALSAFIKAASNRPCKNFKIVLLGTGADASRLVDHDPGIDRIIQEIQLPRFSGAETRAVIEEGMQKLSITINAGELDDAVRVCVGSPALVQYVALEVAEAAFSRDPRVVRTDDIATALQSYIRKKAKRLEDAYLKAIETTGPRRYRKQILHAMASLEEDYVTMDQLVAEVSRQLEEKIPATALSGPLRELKSDSRGRILRDVHQHEGEGGGEGRVFNLSAFTDPSMRTYIRMRLEGEKKHFIP